VRYSAALLEHFRHPRNVGSMRAPDGFGEAEYRECMDVARVYLRVRDERVVEARFQTYGCGPTIAASSAGTEAITGARVHELVDFPDARVIEVLGGLPDDRRHAAEVVGAAIRAAARDACARCARP